MMMMIVVVLLSSTFDLLKEVVYKNYIVGLVDHITLVMKLYLLASLRVLLGVLNRIVQSK